MRTRPGDRQRGRDLTETDRLGLAFAGRQGSGETADKGVARRCRINGLHRRRREMLEACAVGK